MKAAQVNYEQFKLRVDRIADTRGITFNEKLMYIEKAMEYLESGQVLTVYCSDFAHRQFIPEWIRQKGYIFLGMVDESTYFKIIMLKK